MLVSDMHRVGNRLFEIRKKTGLTQAEVAEKAELSDRTYADIERGTTNMRTETLLRICGVLHITPDDLFVEAEAAPDSQQDDILKRLRECTLQERQTALRLVEVYLRSLGK